MLTGYDVLFDRTGSGSVGFASSVCGVPDLDSPPRPAVSPPHKIGWVIRISSLFQAKLRCAYSKHHELCAGCRESRVPIVVVQRKACRMPAMQRTCDLRDGVALQVGVAIGVVGGLIALGFGVFLFHRCVSLAPRSSYHNAAVPEQNAPSEAFAVPACHPPSTETGGRGRGHLTNKQKRRCFDVYLVSTTNHRRHYAIAVGASHVTCSSGHLVRITVSISCAEMSCGGTVSALP